jgi:hypothetical protein
MTLRIALATSATLALGAVSASASSCTDFREGPADGAGDAIVADAGSPFTVVHAVPEGSAFYSVWGADKDHVFAVGSDNLRYAWVGGVWKPFTPIITGQDLECVWGTSATNVYAVGIIRNTGQGIVEHFDGQGWSDEYIAPTPLSAVWGAGALVIATGAQGEIYGKTEGTTAWAPRLANGLPANPKVVNGPDDPVLWAVAGTSIDHFAMAAGLDRVFVYDVDAGFINLDPTVDRTLDFRAVFAVPGSQPTTYLFGTNYLGATWLAGAGPPDASTVMNGMFTLFQDRSSSGTATQYIYGIWGTATRFVFVGDQGRIVSYDAASNEVSAVPSPVTDSLVGVWGSSLSDVWIVGARELILHGSL